MDYNIGRRNIGLGESSLGHRRRDEYPAIFTSGARMNTLSIFIDESGDFGDITQIPSYYLVTLVFHDQSNDIITNVRKLEQSVLDSGFSIEYIHTGPLIRREDVFHHYTIDRKSIRNCL